MDMSCGARKRSPRSAEFQGSSADFGMRKRSKRTLRRSHSMSPSSMLPLSAGQVGQHVARSHVLLLEGGKCIPGGKGAYDIPMED